METTLIQLTLSFKGVMEDFKEHLILSQLRRSKRFGARNPLKESRISISFYLLLVSDCRIKLSIALLLRKPASELLGCH